MKSVSSVLLICLTLVLTGCSSEMEDAISSQVESSETPDASGDPETAETNPNPLEKEQPEEEKDPLPPFDEEKMAKNLEDAGAVFAKIEDGFLTKINFFRSKQPVTDETIKLLVDEHGRTPEKLIELSLYGANLSDESLKIIARIPSLESLNLNHVSGDMTNQGIASMVGSLPNLTTLGLSDSRITNEGLKPLGSLKNLDQSILHRTNIGDEGLPYLKNLQKLETLKLSGTKVTDDGLVHLMALPQLKRLSLNKSDITGAGAIEHLRMLTNLEYLTFPRENFEEMHYDALKAAIPELW